MELEETLLGIGIAESVSYDAERNILFSISRVCTCGGNEVELTNYPSMIHPFFSMGGVVGAERRAMTHAAHTLGRAFSVRWAKRAYRGTV
jgi:hypothetical protein